jgi:hypothetical protein
MKVGDLVKYGPKMGSASLRVGIVVEIHYRVVPTAVVRWNGIGGTMAHRQDLLEVVSESR